MSYHNTNKESGAVLAASEKKAQTQEADVMRVVRAWPEPMFTAEEVWLAFFEHRNIPITSIRRAFSNLTQRGLLKKTNVTKESQLSGKQIYCWREVTTDDIQVMMDLMLNEL